MAARWLQLDEFGSKWMQFYQGAQDWFSLLSSKRHALIARLNDNVPIGFVDIEIDADHANVAYYIRSEYRRMGLGKAMLEEALSWISLQTHAIVVRAYVDPDNLASLSCLQSCGFRLNGSASDLLLYEREV